MLLTTVNNLDRPTFSSPVLLQAYQFSASNAIQTVDKERHLIILSKLHSMRGNSKSTQQKMNNLFQVDENSIEQ